MSFRPEGGGFPKQLGFPAVFNPSFMPPGFPNIPPHSDTPPWQPSEGHRGPATTVFIGNIEDRCTNSFLERMMKECGHVLSWKRIQGSNGKPQAFGFCEFEEPSGTLRALRMLSNLIVNGKQLVVKAEDKVRAELRKWQLKKAKSDGKAVEKEDLKEEGELLADEEERKGDEEARKKIFSWIGTDYPEISISVARKIEEEDDESKSSRKERKHSHKHSQREHEKEHRHRSRRRRSSSRSSSRSSRSSSEEAPRKRKSMSAEEAEAIRELKKLLREKHRSYKKRVDAWEEREEQKARQYEKLKKKSKEEKSHLKHEAHKLRRFLENYDDGEDDKYYKGEPMATRLKLRAKEELEDAKDRLAEEQEIEEAAKKALEEILKTEPADGVTVDDVDLSLKEAEEDAAAGIESNTAEPEKWTATDIEKADEKEEVKKTVVISSGVAPLPKQSNNNLSQVFGMEDEEEVDRLRQRKTLVKFEITAEDRRQHMTDHERKEITRNIIRGIPTSKVILFKHPLDWDQLDEALVDNKIKPWITKKISALIGEEDDSLRDFICEKILARTSATDILEDIKMILDEDAETFVLKLWRLLHYEAEAKRMGVSK